MGKQRKKHETSCSCTRNSRKESTDLSHKNYIVIYLIEVRFQAKIKHNKNRGYIHKSCSNNLSEEIPTFHVIIVILWSPRSPLSYLITNSVSYWQCVDFILSSHPSIYPCLIWTSKNLSFASINTVGSTPQNFFRSASPPVLIKLGPSIGSSIQWLLFSPSIQICAHYPHHWFVHIGSDNSHQFQAVKKHEDYPPEKRFSLSPLMLRVAQSMESGDPSLLPLMVFNLLDIPPPCIIPHFFSVNLQTCSCPMTVNLHHRRLWHILQPPLPSAPLVYPLHTASNPNLYDLTLATNLLTTSYVDTSNGSYLRKKESGH